MNESEKEEELEMEVLSCLYFVEPFDKIVEECGIERNIIADVLKNLIARKMVSAMVFDEQYNEYKRTFIFDSDNMQNYSFLATKEGLMRHNGM